MTSEELKNQKIRRLCSFGLLLYAVSATCACIFFAFFTNMSFYYYLIIIIFGVIPALILFYFNKKDIKYLPLAKNLFCYLLMSLFCFIAIFAGGLRSISLTILYIVPLTAFAFEINILISSLIILIFFSTLVVFWMVPGLDNIILRFNVFPPESLINPNPTYIINYYVVFFVIFIFMNYFKKKDIEYKYTIQKKNEELEKVNFEIEANYKKQRELFIELAHEMKTPLTVIISYLEDYMEKNKDPDIEIVKKNIDNLQTAMIEFLDERKVKRIIETQNIIQEIRYSDETYSEIEKKLSISNNIDENKSNILLIEDNMILLSSLQKKLTKNYNVFIAKDGIAALEKIEFIPIPDIILSDIMMPKMDGYELLDKIHKIEKYKHIPFLFLTALTDDSKQEEAFQKGAIDFISKPINNTILFAKIDSIIKQQQAQKQNIIIKLTEKQREKVQNIYIKHKITIQEQRIISLVLTGLENKEIASKLNISENTIKVHLSNIYSKLKIKSRTELFNLIK